MCFTAYAEKLEEYIPTSYKIRYILEELYVTVLRIISRLIIYIDQLNAANYQVEECEVEANDTALIGNGFCNDITNVRSCDFDGGDCCGENISTEFCEICTCHLDDLTTGN